MITLEPVTKQVLKISLISRFLVTCLAIISDSLLPDHQPDAFQNEILRQHFIQTSGVSILDTMIIRCTKPFTRWDGQYFLSIALHGRYEQEQWLAFYPFYPLLIRMVATVFDWIFWFACLKVSFISCMALAAYVINLLCFLLAAKYLYDLTNFIFNNELLSMNIVRMFSFNPASIFYTAFYTESLFTMLTLKALCNVYIEANLLKASIFLSMAAATRSNGLVSIGYILFYQCIVCWRLSPTATTTRNMFKMAILKILLRKFIATCLYLAIIFSPLLLFNMHVYRTFCKMSSGGGWFATITTTTKPEWCDATIPLSYSSVQAKYWNIGLLNYYHWKQLPNFLLAFPILFVTIDSSYLYFRKNLPFVQQLLLLQTPKPLLESRLTLFIRPANSEKCFNCKLLLPFVIHSSFLSLVCILFMHIQVSNRFLLSANPWPYWATYQLIRMKVIGHRTMSMFKFWFASYFIIGTILFSNFLPFT